METNCRVWAGAAVCAAAAWASTVFAQDITHPGNAITASSTNSPVGEGVTNVIDNTANTKYLNFDILNTGFTVTPSGAGVVTSLGFVTANDSPQRDPASYILEGSTDGVNFTTISQGPLNLPSTRYALGQVVFGNSASYSQYRITFPTVRSAASANSMQIAEVQFNTFGNILTPGDGISATIPSGASIPTGQGVTGLVDGALGVKFNVVGGNLGATTVDITPAAGGTIVSGIDVMGTLDDATFPNRVPATLVLSGSNDGTNYTQLLSTPLTQFTANYSDQQFSFANTTSYTRYRLVFGASPASSMQLGEIQLFGTTLGAAPANDLCANAQTVGEGQTSGTTLFATGTDVSSCGVGDTADVWFRYVSNYTGTVEANTCGAGSLDTVLSVYASCGGAEIGCNDNACLGKSRVRFQAVSGTAYLIRVGGVGGATGSFTLGIVNNPVVHSDVFVPLTYNFNGMVHPGEENNPDNPDGFRSLSDRAMRITGAPGSLDVGPEGVSGIPYSVVTQAGVLDTVELGNRNLADNAGHVFDLTVDGDNVGIEPNWLSFPTDHVDQTGPQTTSLSALNLVMGANTQVGIIGNSSNMGATFTVTLGFADNSSVAVPVTMPDWFGMQTVAAPASGVASQAMLGLFAGAGSVDNGVLDADLNVVEAVVSTQSLMAGGLGDVTGRQLASITFSNSSSTIADTGIYAVTIRDGAPVTPPGVCCRGSTCNVAVAQNACSTGGALAGAFYATSGGVCNGASTTTPCCYPDYNKFDGVTVGDIFDFLNDWFAGQKFAVVGGDGVHGMPSVQNIFDFLNAWFAGCP
jgi:hypothetical protein